MAVYMICNVVITDDSWIPEYAAVVHDIVEKHGGRYFSRSGNITTIEGDDLESSLIAIIEFPSLDHVKRFMADPDYEQYKKARIDGTKSNFHVIDDTDIAGTIPYLPKAS